MINLNCDKHHNTYKTSVVICFPISSFYSLYISDEKVLKRKISYDTKISWTRIIFTDCNFTKKKNRNETKTRYVTHHYTHMNENISLNCTSNTSELLNIRGTEVEWLGYKYFVT